jgi:hypothetical protein
MPAPIVIVSRNAKGWQAVLKGHGLVRARSLVRLDRQIQTLLGHTVRYQFRTGHDRLDWLIRQVRTNRTAVQRHEAESQRYTDDVLRLARDLSQRDLSVLLGLSPQRVCQLVQQRAVGEERKG